MHRKPKPDLPLCMGCGQPSRTAYCDACVGIEKKKEKRSKETLMHKNNDTRLWRISGSRQRRDKPIDHESE